MDQILINLGNITPMTAEVDHDVVIACWAEVEDYFYKNSIKLNEKTSIKIFIDSKSIRKLLHSLKPENCELFLNEYYQEKIKNNLEINHPFSEFLKLNIDLTNLKEVFDRKTFIRHFIEQLFLVMNICTRGGCNYGNISIDGSGKDHSLYCSVLESAWHRATTDTWPKLDTLPFHKVWQWMERNGGLTYFLAETPVRKAMAVLLHLSYNTDPEATSVVQISQVLESFYLRDKEPKIKGLSTKIPFILGAFPSNGARWITDLYNLRSKIVHGEFPIFRPRYFEDDSGFDAVEDIYWEISSAIDRGVSIIIATIQDLIIKNSDYYIFKEEILVEVGTYD